MHFRCLFNRKNTKGTGKPSCLKSGCSFLCILPPKSRSVSPVSRSPPSQCPQRSSGQRRKMLLKSEGKRDKAIQECLPPSSDLPSSRSAEKLEKLFQKFDANGDGKISSSELGNLMRSLGENPTNEELLDIFSDAGLDGDGCIDLAEFVALNSESVDSSCQLEFLIDVFKKFDKDGDGSISPHELVELLRRLRVPCTLDDCQAIITKLDDNGDGLLTLENFLAIIKRSDDS